VHARDLRLVANGLGPELGELGLDAAGLLTEIAAVAGVSSSQVAPKSRLATVWM